MSRRHRSGERSFSLPGKLKLLIYDLLFQTFHPSNPNPYYQAKVLGQTGASTPGTVLEKIPLGRDDHDYNYRIMRYLLGAPIAEVAQVYQSRGFIGATPQALSEQHYKVVAERIAVLFFYFWEAYSPDLSARRRNELWTAASARFPEYILRYELRNLIPTVVTDVGQKAVMEDLLACLTEALNEEKISKEQYVRCCQLMKILLENAHALPLQVQLIFVHGLEVLNNEKNTSKITVEQYAQYDEKMCGLLHAVFIEESNPQQKMAAIAEFTQSVQLRGKDFITGEVAKTFLLLAASTAVVIGISILGGAGIGAILGHHHVWAAAWHAFAGTHLTGASWKAHAALAGSMTSAASLVLAAPVACKFRLFHEPQDARAALTSVRNTVASELKRPSDPGPAASR